MIKLILAVALVLASVACALAFKGQPMSMNGGGGVPTNVAPLSASVADNAASGTSVARLGCTTSDGSNTGCTFQVTDPQGYLKVVGSTLETTGAAMTDGTYSNILLQATKNGVTYPNDSGTIACTVGPNYQGSVPEGAAAAGFNTCAFNLDATQLTAAQIVDCLGAANPILWNFPNCCGGTSPCSAYSTATDAGGQSLDIRLPAGPIPQGVGSETFNPAQTLGQIFPQTLYVEMRTRLSANTGTNCSGTGFTGVGCDLQTFFTYRMNNPGVGSPPSNTSPWGEWDHWECFTGTFGNGFVGGSCDSSLHTGGLFNVGFSQALAANNAIGFGDGGRFGVTADVTAWHTYAIRIVSDGAANLAGTVNGNVSWCAYLDNVLQTCNHGAYANACSGGCSQDLFQFREGPQFQLSIPGSGATATTLAADQDLYIQRYTIFTCNDPRNLTRSLLEVGNTCLNSTADVTGRLTGAP